MITVARRIRPLRLAFLIDRDKDATLELANLVNTCLWGGSFNALVPILGRRPSWWRGSWPGWKQVARGYLTAFEPDYVVTDDEALARELDFDQARVVGLRGFLGNTEADDPRLGLSSFEIYQFLYKREFQFVRKQPKRVIYPDAAGPLAAFIRLCFGALPQDKHLAYFEESYRDAFDPEVLAPTPSLLFETLETVTTPASVTSIGLDVLPRGFVSGPSLFFFDPTSVIDLIDYWNLRALGCSVLPVPAQWADELTEPCRTFVRANNVPIPGNPAYRRRTMLISSRTIAFGDVQHFAPKIHDAGDDALLLMHYPQFWDQWTRERGQISRCRLIGPSHDIQLTSATKHIEFTTLRPPFASRYGSKPRWANVIAVRNYDPVGRLASVVPPDLGTLDRLLQTHDHAATYSSSEGIVLHCKETAHVRWRLPEPLQVFQAWCATHSLTSTSSSAGRIANEMLHALGGLWGASALAHPEILDLLHKLAHGMLDISEPAEGKEARKHKARARFIPHTTLWQQLLQRHKNDINAAKADLGFLTDRILRIGVVLKCLRCEDSGWFGFKSLADGPVCDSCEAPVPFPSADPTSVAWAYRSRPPFSVENLARGSYSVVLALRFLTALMHAEATCVASVEMKVPHEKPLEADFALWRAGFSISRSGPSLIFGECKSFENRFSQRDFTRARALARRFPGAALAFVTLRESGNLTAQERNIIRGIAETGRKYWTADRPRTPVMVLTAHELYSEEPPPRCWKSLGSVAEKVIDEYRRRDDLLELCDATQRIHLGMESYADWQQRDFEQRRLRWEQAQRRRQLRAQSNVNPLEKATD